MVEPSALKIVFYPASPKSNLTYIQAIYNRLGKTPPYGTVPSGIAEKDSVKYLYNNNKTQRFPESKDEAKEIVADFRTGDLILIGDEIYIVLYNTTGMNKTGKEGDADFSVETSQLVLATVAGGGKPRLISYRCETLFDYHVGFGYVKSNLY